MHDSIFVKNIVMNDSDSLSSHAQLKVSGTTTPLTFNNNTRKISCLVHRNKIQGVISEMISVPVYEKPSVNPIFIRPVMSHVKSIKFSTYIYSQIDTDKKIDFNHIHIDVSQSLITTSLIQNSCSLYAFKNLGKDTELKESMINYYVSKKLKKDILFDMVSVSVMEGNLATKEGQIAMPTVTVDVNNDYPMAEGPIGGANGGDLEKMVFTIQQMSFFEFRFYFRANKVKEVTNLPNGMHFDKEKQRMFGTPLLSNRYPINILLEDGSNVQGIIEVPKLNREL